jgi:DNA polymerase I
MRSLTFAAWPSYSLLFLVPALQKDAIQKEYLDPFEIPTDDVKCLPLHFEGKKTSVAVMKQYIKEELIPEIQSSGAKYLIVADAGYYKLLTSQSQAEANLGYVQPCVFEGTAHPWHVIYVPSIRSIFYDPERIRAKIAQGIQALLTHIQGGYQHPGDGIIHFETYPQTDTEIEEWLEKLLAMECPLTIDIEAFSLKHYKAGIGSITFCWNKHEGIAFPVDYVPCEPYEGEDGKTHYGRQVRNATRRKLLRAFFIRLKQKAIYHNISFDVYNLVYQLFMEDVLDRQGMLDGMEIMLQNWDDTQLIVYLATNSCAGNVLGLKPNSQEYSGNYSVDELEDITLIPLDKLLRYNLIDGLSTWYVHEKYYDRMVADQQLEIYETLFKPTVWDIIEMQLTGLPLNMERVKEVKVYLQAILDEALRRIYATKTIQQFTYLLQEKHVAERNAELKKKRISMSDQETLDIKFNPNSGPQLQELLYKMLGLPVIDLTEKKNPATGGDTLEKLRNHTTDPDVLEFLAGMKDYSDVKGLLTTFIPAFEDAMPAPDGWHYLTGSFKLGGTISGRLSSNNPNMQNLPVSNEMLISDALLALFPELKKFTKKGKLHLGKLIKTCFAAPPGWILCGLDFNALEDRISALTTKDPNKLKVYLDGYDGHCLRAYAYWGDRMPDIDPNSVDSINSIKDKYPNERYDGKRPTFALTYQGTWITLVRNLGFKEAAAKLLEGNFKKLYVASIKWVQEKLDRAAKDGYITVAFGLRLRTPLLAQVVRGNSRTPHEAEAEGRTAGNALGQSWCLLTNRASIEFMQRVRHEQHRLDIRACAQIHDAQYHLVRENVSTLLYANKHLVKAVQWQDHPEIAHPDVRLGGVFSIFWPDWSHDIEIPNGADEAVLMAALEARLERV